MRSTLHGENRGTPREDRPVTDLCTLVDSMYHHSEEGQSYTTSTVLSTLTKTNQLKVPDHGTNITYRWGGFNGLPPATSGKLSTLLRYILCIAWSGLAQAFVNSVLLQGDSGAQAPADRVNTWAGRGHRTADRCARRHYTTMQRVGAWGVQSMLTANLCTYSAHKSVDVRAHHAGISHDNVCSAGRKCRHDS
jgi:hypothetical protein